jgi:hypothetical protein
MAPKDEEFNLIKQDLITQIQGMRTDINNMRSDMNRYFEMTNTHERALYGDKIKEPGITEDVRSLKKVAGYAAAGLTGTVGLIGEFLFRTFVHHIK